MAEVANLNVLDANNTARFPEGQIIPTLNDGGRALEGILARWEKDTNGSIASSGSVNAFAILTNRVIPAHAAGNEFKFRATTANTGASTIAINALAAKPLRRHGGGALQSGDISTNQIVHIVYNAAEDYYECIGISGGGGGDSLPSGGTTGQVLAKASGDDGDVEWITAEGTGDMLASMYDPEGVEGDAFDMDNMADGETKVAMLATERSKLSGIAAGATQNSADATLLARGNHTGEQAISTITGLQSALDGKATSAQGELADSAVQPGDLGDLATKNAVAISDITATGTADGTTYLRGDGVWATPTGEGGGIANVVEDTTPQLGGDLDLNGNNILGMVIGTDIQAYSANLDEFAGVNPSANGLSLVSAADYAAMRALLDLEAGTDFLSPAAIAAAYQPLDSDLTAIAALTTTAAGRSVLTIADPGADRIVAWDDTAGAMAAIALADITTEAAPAAGDYLLLYTAEGALVKVDWDDLPAGGGGSGVEEGDSPTWTGAHTFARGTITDSSPSIAITQTWNDAADTFVGFDMDITNTASAAASKLIDLKVGGSTLFRLRPSGDAYLSGLLQLGGTQDAGNHAYIKGSGGTLIYISHIPGDFPSSVKAAIEANAGRFIVGNSGNFAWGNPTTGAMTLQLWRDGADDTMAQRRGTNAQTFRLYNTHTDASNYERLSIGWGSNICTIQTQAAGTGTLRNLVFNGANRATYSETPADIAAALVAWGIMAPSE